jgi:hypothetical protein
MDELPEVPTVSISQVVNVGVVLKRRLEVAAREQGADATYLARKILREQLRAERALWPKGEHGERPRAQGEHEQ